MCFLKLPLGILQQVLSVRGVDNEDCPIIAGTRESRQQDKRNCRPSSHLPSPLSERRFTKRRVAPLTPAGSCRKNASVVYTYVPLDRKSTRLNSSHGYISY